MRTDFVFVYPLGLDHSEVSLPLNPMRLMALEPGRWNRRGRQRPFSLWRATVSDAGRPLTIQWLLLVWLAHLARWDLPNILERWRQGSALEPVSRSAASASALLPEWPR